MAFQTSKKITIKKKKYYYIIKNNLNQLKIRNYRLHANSGLSKHLTDNTKLEEMHQLLCRSLEKISISNNLKNCNTNDYIMNIGATFRLTLETAFLIARIVSIDFNVLSKLLQSVHELELQLRIINVVLLTDGFYSFLTYDKKYFNIWSKRLDLIRIIEEADQKIANRVNLAAFGVLAATNRKLSRELLIKMVINKTNILNVNELLTLNLSGTSSQRQFINIIYKSQNQFSSNITSADVNATYTYCGAVRCIDILANSHKDIISTCLLSRHYFRNLSDEAITRQQFIYVFQEILSRYTKTRSDAATKLRNDESPHMFKLTKIGPAILSMSGKNTSPLATILKRQKEYREIYNGTNLCFLSGQFTGTRKYEIKHTLEELLQEGCILDMDQHMHVLLHVPNVSQSNSIYIGQTNNKFRNDGQGNFFVLQPTDIVEQ